MSATRNGPIGIWACSLMNSSICSTGTPDSSW